MSDTTATSASTAGDERYRLGFHIAPREGWLNDPNGLCQFRGRYHAFFQYNPEWPERDTKHWRHFVSGDLVRWHDEGTALVTDVAEDRDGVYSGSALVRSGMAADGGDQLWLYYTGNVIDPEAAAADPDFVHAGREANEILVTSDDALAFSEKHVLLRNADYPGVCTLHVRDPKVWEQDGRLWMLLGARDQDDEGFALLYGSDDGLEWRIESQIYSRRPFGYMWECPNVVRLDGHDYLAVCPQGLPNEDDRWHNTHQAGYFPLASVLTACTLVDEKSFVEWDHGFDFYAPQIFVDDADRAILVGWMGTFGDEWTSAPNGLAWCHCLTVPRELTRGADGLLRQRPVVELEALRGASRALATNAPVILDAHRADVALTGVTGEGTLSLDEALEVSFAKGRLSVRFRDERVAAGRRRRSVPLEQLDDLRVLVDASAVELYANGGTLVFSTRWFPVSDTLTIETTLSVASATVYEMEDAMAHAFD